MNYDRMTQLALRGVVRDAIRRVIREGGLPGAHHFYITFLTRFPGVDIDESLSKKYPEEVTIVLEHQYWDLKAHDDSFEVTLKFGGVPKYLSVPYTAISRFHDPSVSFALQFDPPEEMAESAPSNEGQNKPSPKARTPLTLATLKPESGPKAVPRAVKPEAKPKKTAKKKTDAKNKTAAKSKTAAKKDGKNKDGENKVISLDAFRKK